MILFPAIDIQGGNAVRLKQGQKDQVTVFAQNPLDMARHWKTLGARWLHIVDLDGAFEGFAKSAPIIRQICEDPDLSIQIGGGIRDLASARAYMDTGASRVIIGTMALENPDLFGQLCREFPNRVGISLDAENGVLKTRGWEKSTEKTVEDALPQLEKLGAAFVIYTDIERDGMQTGVNMEALEKLLRLAQIPVICAGGISSIEDLQRIYDRFNGTLLEGVISGRALYEGNIDFARASKLLESGQYGD